MSSHAKCHYILISWPWHQSCEVWSWFMRFKWFNTNAHTEEAVSIGSFKNQEQCYTSWHLYALQFSLTEEQDPGALVWETSISSGFLLVLLPHARESRGIKDILSHDSLREDIASDIQGWTSSSLLCPVHSLPLSAWNITLQSRSCRK